MGRVILVLVLMILGHLLADYPLQGWLAQAKAKSYWENAPEENKKDYIPALLGHATMWGIIRTKQKIREVANAKSITYELQP